MESGQVLREWDLAPKSWQEPGKDLVVTHLKDEDSFVKDLDQSFSFQVSAINLLTGPPPPDQVRNQLFLASAIVP